MDDHCNRVLFLPQAGGATDTTGGRADFSLHLLSSSLHKASRQVILGHYSKTIFFSRITLPHFTRSAATRACRSCGVPGMVS